MIFKTKYADTGKRILSVSVFILFIVISLAQKSLAVVENDEKVKKMQEHYFYAIDCYKKGDYEKAIGKLEEILKLDPGHSESLRMIEKCQKLLENKALSSAEKKGSEDDFFARGIEKYSSGDLENAALLLEKAFEKNSKSKKIKAFLVKVLTELGMDYSVIGNYSKALIYLEKARKIDPHDKTLGEIYRTTRSLTEVSDSQEKMEKDESLSSLISLFSTFQKEQTKLMNIYLSGESRYKEMISRGVKEREMLLKKLEKKEEFSQRLIQRIVVFGASGIIAIALLIFIILRVSGAKREKILGAQEIKILDLMQKNVTPWGKPATSLENSQVSAREMLESINPHVRAKGVEIIDVELEKEGNRNLAEKMLSQFLKDDNNRVKANACKALYKYNKKRALNTLEEMVKNKDRWMRASAAWALSEIKSDKAAEMLFNLLEDIDYHVKRRALKGLQIILDNGLINSFSLMKKIQLKVNEKKVDEGWVVK